MVFASRRVDSASGARSVLGERFPRVTGILDDIDERRMVQVRMVPVAIDAERAAADGSRRSGTPAGDKPRPPHRIYPRTETAIGTGYRSGKSVRVRGCSASAKSTATNGIAVSL